MGTPHQKSHKRSLARNFSIFIVASLLVSSHVYGRVKVNVPPDPYGPVFVRTLDIGDQITTDWIPLIFYRTPDIVAAMHPPVDLSAIFDVRAFNFLTTVEGFVIYENADDLQNFRSPYEINVHQGSDGVPIWFVARPAWEALSANGTVTISELIRFGDKNPEALLKGVANLYEEVLHPDPTYAGGGAQVTMDDYRASGFIYDENGNSLFTFSMHMNFGPQGDLHVVKDWRIVFN
jgi:hypothetical protein